MRSSLWNTMWHTYIFLNSSLCIKVFYFYIYHSALVLVLPFRAVTALRTAVTFIHHLLFSSLLTFSVFPGLQSCCSSLDRLPLKCPWCSLAVAESSYQLYLFWTSSGTRRGHSLTEMMLVMIVSYLLNHVYDSVLTLWQVLCEYMPDTVITTLSVQSCDRISTFL